MSSHNHRKTKGVLDIFQIFDSLIKFSIYFVTNTSKIRKGLKFLEVHTNMNM